MIQARIGGWVPSSDISLMHIKQHSNVLEVLVTFFKGARNVQICLSLFKPAASLATSSSLIRSQGFNPAP